jgi:hypothetical protein
MSDSYGGFARCELDCEVGDPVSHTADYFMKVISEESHTVRAEHKVVVIF